ncbi:hypothetical protein NITLEN_20388 [Nitrospira lenta]|uniref:Uncharacterized protein n=1 Tax=Nitrospira lenta TaxID=1436998 RepID=A0A330L4J6_9BACT|nr:hypothetical protein NITLEN_20388 [Nitrospira lenta]
MFRSGLVGCGAVALTDRRSWKLRERTAIPGETERHSATTSLAFSTCRSKSKPFDQGPEEAGHEIPVNPFGYVSLPPTIALPVGEREWRTTSGVLP